MPPAGSEGLSRLAEGALSALLHLALALSYAARGNMPAAVQALSDLIDSGGGGIAAEEALLWRAGLAEAGGNFKQAARDYEAAVRRLPPGRRARVALLRLAALSEPGRNLTPEEALVASRSALGRIGSRLHDYAADHGGALPGALEDLLDGYVSDPQLLVRPGRRGEGGARPYVYRPGLRADLFPERGLSFVAWEPVGRGGKRLALRLDGEVFPVQVDALEAGSPHGALAEGEPAAARKGR